MWDCDFYCCTHLLYLYFYRIAKVLIFIALLTFILYEYNNKTFPLAYQGYFFDVGLCCNIFKICIPNIYGVLEKWQKLYPGYHRQKLYPGYQQQQLYLGYTSGENSIPQFTSCKRGDDQYTLQWCQVTLSCSPSLEQATSPQCTPASVRGWGVQLPSIS